MSDGDGDPHQPAQAADASTATRATEERAAKPDDLPPEARATQVRGRSERAAPLVLAAVVAGLIVVGAFATWISYTAAQPGEPPGDPSQVLQQTGLSAPAQSNGSTPPTPLTDPPDARDADAVTCDRLASHPSDPQRVGDGVVVRWIDVAQALPACERAASRTARPRYQYEYGRVLDAASRASEAIEQYTRASRGGYAMADINLGTAYIEGRGVARNSETAVAFLSRADAAGIRDAAGLIGDAYLYGEPHDYAQAKTWYEAAMQRGDSQGFAGLAVLYDLGLGIAEDRVRGAQLARQAADLGNVNGMFWLGRHYKDGQGVAPDPIAACEWFNRAARAYYAYGQFEAGRCLYTGAGGVRDHAAAFYWLIRAANAGLPEARELVADMYDSGDGVAAANAAEAVAWYRQAAEQNDVYGMMQLAIHLREGRGVAWSEAEAMQWFEKAARTGYAAAQSSLAEGYLLGLGQGAGQGRQDYQQAAYWFGEAAKQGEGFAQLNLGVMYENGWGVAQDLDRAKDLYAQAAKSSNAGAARVAGEYLASLSASMADAQRRARADANKPSNADAWIGIIGTAVAVGAVAEFLSWASSGPPSDRGSAAPSSSVDYVPDYTSDWNWGSGVSTSGGGSLTIPVDPPTRPDLYYPGNPTKSVIGDLSDPSIAHKY